MKVFIAQFVKGQPYNEISIINDCLEKITIRQYGRKCFIEELPDNEDIKAARHGLEDAEKVIIQGEHGLVILDEMNIALHYNLFSLSEVIRMIKAKPKHVELVITGRYAPQKLIDIADLVTHMDEVKHYYNKGIEARPGIEY